MYKKNKLMKAAAVCSYVCSALWMIAAGCAYGLSCKCYWLYLVLSLASLYNGFVINDNCKNCKSCLKLGCPAIVNGKNGMTIDASLCTECGLCASVCKFGAIAPKA